MVVVRAGSQIRTDESFFGQHGAVGPAPYRSGYRFEPGFADGFLRAFDRAHIAMHVLLHVGVLFSDCHFDTVVICIVELILDRIDGLDLFFEFLLVMFAQDIGEGGFLDLSLNRGEMIKSLAPFCFGGDLIFSMEANSTAIRAALTIRSLASPGWMAVPLMTMTAWAALNVS